VQDEPTPEGSTGNAGSTGRERTPAAMAIAEVFSNVEFPKDKSELVSIAEKNKEKTRYQKELMDVLPQFRDRKYISLEDMDREVGHISSV
jgi:hypothetical protein